MPRAISASRLRLGIALFFVIAAATQIAEATYQVFEERNAAIEAEQASAEKLIDSLEEHFSRTVQGAELVLRLAAEQAQHSFAHHHSEPAHSDVTQLNHYFQDLKSRAPQIQILSAIGENGRIWLHSADGPPPPLDLSRAPSFLALRDNPKKNAESDVSPARMRLVGDRTPFIPLERRIEHPDGRFAGIVVAILDPTYFQGFYTRVRSGSVSSLAILSDTGVLLAEIAGENAPADPKLWQQSPRLAESLAQRPAGGIFSEGPDALGSKRYVVYQRIGNLPYVIAAAIPEEAVLARWREELVSVATAHVIVTLAMLVIGVFLMLEVSRRDSLSRDLAASEARFRDFADAASDWVWEMGPDLRFTHFSGSLPGAVDAARKLVGRTREEVLDPSDRPPNWEAHLNDLRHRRPFRDFIYRARWAGSGSFRYCKISGKPLFDAAGTFIGYRGTGSDITEIVLAEQAAARAKMLLTEALCVIEEGFILFDAEDRLVMWNERFAQIHSDAADLLVAGSRFEDMIRTFVQRSALGADKERAEALIAQRLAAHRAARSAQEWQMADGRWIRIQEHSLPDGGRVGIHSDVTDVKRREQELCELAQKNALFAATVSTTASGVVITDPNLPDNPIIYVNAAFTALTGYEAEEAIGHSTKFLRASPGDSAAVVIDTAWREGRSVAARVLNRRKDGGLIHVDVRVSPVRAADGRITHFVHIQNDVTAQVQAGEKLREREEQIRSTAANVPGVLFQRVQRRDGTLAYTYVGERSIDLFGYPAQDFLADPGLLCRLFGMADRALYRHALVRSAQSMTTADVEVQIIRRDGERRWVRAMFRPRRADSGDLIWDGLIIDVSDRVEAEAKLRESEAQIRSLAANLPGVTFQRAHRAGRAAVYTYVSARVADLIGYAAEEIIADPSLITNAILPEDRARFIGAQERSVRELKPLEAQFRLRRRDGEVRVVRIHSRPRLLLNEDVVCDGVVLDVTEQQHAEQKRLELESQLRHSQKIEALGTLAGGIAHDVNNTLVPIVALSQLTLKALGNHSPHRESLQTILEASYRVRDLVAEILAFSRKEMPKTSVVRLQDVVAKSVRLLAATIPASISLVPVMAEDVEPVGVDENQIVQVLMNLCTNAAHAIGAKTGRIEIALDNVSLDAAGAHPSGLPAGRYARLRVVDDGCGMEAVTLRRIFEPFYTTKGVGEGTGLGLAVVHGIVANHGGRITAESEPGRGSTFTVLLPLAETRGPARAADRDRAADSTETELCYSNDGA